MIFLSGPIHGLLKQGHDLLGIMSGHGKLGVFYGGFDKKSIRLPGVVVAEVVEHLLITLEGLFSVIRS